MSEFSFLFASSTLSCIQYEMRILDSGKISRVRRLMRVSVSTLRGIQYEMRIQGSGH